MNCTRIATLSNLVLLVLLCACGAGGGGVVGGGGTETEPQSCTTPGCTIPQPLVVISTET